MKTRKEFAMSTLGAMNLDHSINAPIFNVIFSISFMVLILKCFVTPIDNRYHAIQG